MKTKLTKKIIKLQLEKRGRQNNERLTAVLQDLGGSDKSKIGLVLGNISEKIKNWEGYPQTSQSHETLAVSLA